MDPLSDPLLSQIEQAMSGMFGEGADMLLGRLYAELGRESTGGTSSPASQLPLCYHYFCRLQHSQSRRIILIRLVHSGLKAEKGE